MNQRGYRIRWIVFGALWTGLAVLSLADGRYVVGGIYLAFGVAWLLMARSGNWFAAARERQRARVKGHGAISFPPASSSRENE